MLTGFRQANCLLNLVQRASGISRAGIWMLITVHITCWPDSINLYSHSRRQCRLHNATVMCKCSCYVDHSMGLSTCMEQGGSNTFLAPYVKTWAVRTTPKTAPTASGVLSGLLSLDQCNRMYVVLGPGSVWMCGPSVQEERDSFGKLLIGGGFTDVWRHRYPDMIGYTYWNFRFNTRASNKGWRLDYFLVC